MSKSKFSLPLLFVLFAFCSGDAYSQTTGKNPVIIIPGIQGSKLVNSQTGKTVWFDVKREKDDDLRLPMNSTNLSRNRDNLVAADIIREIKLPILPDVEVYQGLIDSLKGRGYAEADWNKPQAADVFYAFPYDWRRDNVESARLLIQKIEAVKRAVRRPDLKFDIIAHSMGGLVARYGAMYGTADLPPEGRNPVPSWAGAQHIRKLLIFGTPNEGAFVAFEALLEGSPIVADRKLPFVDDFRPEDILTVPSVYQLMPHQKAARFLDENLQPMEVDLYDPKTWRTYGWGAINNPKFLSKLKDADRLAAHNKEVKPVKLDKDANFDDRVLSQTTYAEVQAYFAAVLSRAKRFHLALDAPTQESPVKFYVFGAECHSTLDAVVLMHDNKKDRWITLTRAHDIKTSSGREIPSGAVKEAMFAPGDGRVTTRSLLAGSKSSKAGTGGLVKAAFPVTSSFFACGHHSKLFLEKTIQDSLFSALVVEKTQQP